MCDGYRASAPLGRAWRDVLSAFQPALGPVLARARPALAGRWAARGLLAMAFAVLAGCATAPAGPRNAGSAGAPPAAQATQADSGADSGISGGIWSPLTRRSSPAMVPGGLLQPIQTGSTMAFQVVTLDTPTDLWERVRRGFALANLEGDLVNQHEQWYATRPDYIQRMTERSSKYLFHVVEELERRNMPAELALLPFIESAFNPQAVSSAKAMGMWQFMPGTGKDFDLTQNAFRDDRRDVLASTRAALDYLQLLHRMFNDWHLALAAYNWGQGNVKKAIERNQRKGLPTGYEDLTMPAETRHYVPKLQAVKNIIARPSSFKTRLPNIGNHPFFDTVAIDKDMDVAQAARLAEIAEEDFRALNPSLHRPIIMASGSPQILLPWDNAGVFKRNLQYHIGPLASWTAWAVPGHMRTADIAKRFSMSDSELRQLNQIPPNMLVRAGSTLLVPRNSNAQAEVPSHLAEHAHLSLQPETVRQRATTKARKHDTLATLAKRLSADVSDLAQWNKLSANASLRAGQSLVYYREVSARAATLSSAMTSPRASATIRTKSSASSKASPSVAPKSAAGTGRGNAAPRKSRTAVAPKPSRSNKPVKPRRN